MENSTFYSKIFWSANTQSIAKFAVFISIIIFIFSRIDAGLAGVVGFSFLLLLVIRAVQVIFEPDVIVLTETRIELKNMIIPWRSISEIRFDRPIYDPGIYGWDGAGILDVLIPNQKIIILMDDHSQAIIYPRIYKDNDKLRKQIGKQADQNDIKYVIRDRGLWQP